MPVFMTYSDGDQITDEPHVIIRAEPPKRPLLMRVLASIWGLVISICGTILFVLRAIVGTVVMLGIVAYVQVVEWLDSRDRVGYR